MPTRGGAVATSARAGAQLASNTIVPRSSNSYRTNRGRRSASVQHRADIAEGDVPRAPENSLRTCNDQFRRLFFFTSFSFYLPFWSRLQSAERRAQGPANPSLSVNVGKRAVFCYSAGGLGACSHHEQAPGVAGASNNQLYFLESPPHRASGTAPLALLRRLPDERSAVRLSKTIGRIRAVSRLP